MSRSSWPKLFTTLLWCCHSVLFLLGSEVEEAIDFACWIPVAAPQRTQQSPLTIREEKGGKEREELGWERELDVRGGLVRPWPFQMLLPELNPASPHPLFLLLPFLTSCFYTLSASFHFLFPLLVSLPSREALLSCCLYHTEGQLNLPFIFTSLLRSEASLIYPWS